ncbi:MAG: cytochrome c biosis protein CcmH, partial [Actinomycetota bacterium]
MSETTTQRRVPRRAAWLVIIVAAAALLVFGTVREGGPLTQQDRIDAVTKRIACPTCDGESVYVSRASAAESIRAEVARQVGDGVRTDDEIGAYVAERFGGQVLLVPRATGLDAVVWILPPLFTAVLLGALW